jgi:putative SOS response-associated peptidase YedK
MCFSVNVNLVKEEIELRYGVDFPGKYRYEPSYYYHAFGLPEIPAICSGKPGTVTMVRWGLIPGWVKSQPDADEIRFRTFNAKSETLAEKPSFAPSLKSMRCIIPVRGFFEWQHAGKLKIPWYISLQEGQIITLAGLYSEWTGPGSGETQLTFSIITTEANEMMAKIHNSGKRMPAILSHEDEKKWLDLSAGADDVRQLLKPYPQELLKAHTISPLVNDRNANRNTPDLIKPYDYPQTELLF